MSATEVDFRSPVTEIKRAPRKRTAKPVPVAEQSHKCAYCKHTGPDMTEHTKEGITFWLCCKANDCDIRKVAGFKLTELIERTQSGPKDGA